MAISHTVERIEIDKLSLDPRNPRLGRHFVGRNPSQQEVLQVMQEWALEELAVSFLESGFWTQEALVVVRENVQGEDQQVVVEGNRRLAALKLLDAAARGREVPARWKELAAGVAPDVLSELRLVPCIRADSRKEVQAYLGFRHVTGIKEWAPAEKAEFIAHLVDEEGLSYEHVMRRIGSKTPTVRQNYIAYRLLRQMEVEGEDISIDRVEERFSVLYLSLRSSGTQRYLGLNLTLEPGSARSPVPKSRSRHLRNFARWVFGTEKVEPIIRDSRQMDAFGRILENREAIAYLERSDRPSFETAHRIAGGDEAETIEHVERAADEVEAALSTAHRFKKSRRLETAAGRLGTDAIQLLEYFPETRDKLFIKEK